MKKLLWLDDYRDPSDKEQDWMVFSCLGRDCEIHWVKDYNEFTTWITENGLPDGINFDHDLEDYKENNETTGFHCAKWLVEYCMDNNKKLPKWSSHSANPVGRDNINNLLFNYLKHENTWNK